MKKLLDHVPSAVVAGRSMIESPEIAVAPRSSGDPSFSFVVPFGAAHAEPSGKTGFVQTWPS